MITISCSPPYFLQSCLSLTLNILAAIIPVWTSIIFALMRPRMILHFDIFPAFYLASCRWPPISREQITMSIRTFLIFLLHFGHCFLFAFVGILFSATPTFVTGNQIMLPKANSSLLQIPLLPSVATENIHSKIPSELRM